MTSFIIRRLLMLIPVLLGVSILIFTLMRVVPTDLAAMILGENITQESLATLRKELGLDKPLPLQYVDWLGKVLTGDFGRSIWLPDKSVSQRMLERLPVTFELALIATSVGIIFGVSFGVLAAVHQDTWIDNLARAVGIVGLAAPSFWIATMIILFPAILWGWSLPAAYVNLGENPGTHLMKVVPAALVLGFSLTATIMRYSRTTLLEVLRQDYVRTARAKGLEERVVIYRHALKNALIPVVTVTGQAFARQLGGTVIIETVFNIPGVGLLMIGAITARDYNMVQGGILVLAFFLAFSNLVVDVLYAVLDPRIRYS